MAESFRERRELRDRFIRAVYDLRDPNTGQAMGNAIMQRMALDPDSPADEARYVEIDTTPKRVILCCILREQARY